MWASNRIDIQELAEIRKQFKLKYGKKFEEDAMMNAGGVINERILVKLSVQPPSAMLVQAYLMKIAEEFEVDWRPQQELSKDQMNAPMEAPIGYSVSVAGGSGLGGAHSYHNSDDGSSTIPPPAPYNGGGGTAPYNGGGGTPAPYNGGGGGLPVVMGVPALPTAPSSRFNESNKPPTSEISYSNDIPAAPGAADDLTTKSSEYDDIEARFQRLNGKK